MSAYGNSNENSELVDSVRIVYDENPDVVGCCCAGRVNAFATPIRSDQKICGRERVLEYADNTSGELPDESLTGLQFMYHTKIVRHINSELNVEKEAAYFFDTEKNEWQMEYELTLRLCTPLCGRRQPVASRSCGEGCVSE